MTYLIAMATLDIRAVPWDFVAPFLGATTHEGGRFGGRVQRIRWWGPGTPRCQVKLDGSVGPHTFEGATICFDVPVVQSDGTKDDAVGVGGAE